MAVCRNLVVKAHTFLRGDEGLRISLKSLLRDVAYLFVEGRLLTIDFLQSFNLIC